LVKRTVCNAKHGVSDVLIFNFMCVLYFTRRFVSQDYGIIPGLCRRMTVAVVCLVCSDQLTALAEGSVCVASAFPIATGKHIGDCDSATLCAFDLSFVHASAGSWRCKEHGKHT
jgi:hypothetical protein